MLTKANFPNLKMQCIWLGLAILLLMATDLAWAQGAAGPLPWDTPLQTIKNSLTGPVARAIGVVALAAAGGMLAFGGELGDFTKRILMIVLALAVLLVAQSFVDLFPQAAS